MSDYISKAEAIDKIHWGINDEAFFGEPEIDQAVMKFLGEFPSADVRENIHGEWIETYDELDSRYSRHGYKCLKCNKFAHYFVGGSEDWWDIEKPNFCPNCGSDMRGDK